MKQLQIRNAQNVDLLRPYLQHRVEPNYSWRDACSMFLALPALRGFWPLAPMFYTVANRAADLSRQGNDLDDNNTPTFGYDSLAPYVEFNGTTQYLSIADGGAGSSLDILGTETYIEPGYKGLTIGGWFYFDLDSPLVTGETLIGKEQNNVTRCYRVFRSVAGNIIFTISNNGAAFINTTSTGVYDSGEWFFCVGKYVPSTEAAIFVNGDWDRTLVGIYASLFDSTSPFTIGALAFPSTYLDGKASMCFVCAADIGDTLVESLYEQTRTMYNQ